MFVTAFGESFAFVSLLFPGTSLLIAAGTLMAAGSLPYFPILAGAVTGAGLGAYAAVRRRRRRRCRGPPGRVGKYRDAGLRGSYPVRHRRRRLGGDEVGAIEDLSPPLTGGCSTAQMTSIARAFIRNASV